MKYDLLETVKQDFINYYSFDNLKVMAISFAAGGIFANTSIDENLQKDYQDDIRDSGTDDFAGIAKTFGEGKYLIPLSLAAAASGYYIPEKNRASAIGTWGFNTARAYFVGAPPMLLMQRATGASRPGETGDGSDWNPFEDSNGVSGHSFMGAVPFITLGQMYKNSPVKWLFYGGSFITGWSRVNDNKHYVSQVALGWIMAWQSVRSVFLTDRERENGFCFNIAPNDDGGAQFTVSCCW
ncbi:MAG: phosphatase PAP2 family protein [Desulfosalsimonas sp.]